MWTSERIKELRARFGETQEQFARRLGITKFGLRIWEQDQAKPSEMAQILLDRLEKEVPAAAAAKSKEKQPA